MAYEWDPQKEDLNRSKHGIDFAEAGSVFEDPLFVTFADPDHSVGEQRFLILGESQQGRLMVVSYTERQGEIRLISARKATRRERTAYEDRNL